MRRAVPVLPAIQNCYTIMTNEVKPDIRIGRSRSEATSRGLRHSRHKPPALGNRVSGHFATRGNLPGHCNTSINAPTRPSPPHAGDGAEWIGPAKRLLHFLRSYLAANRTAV